MAQPSVPTSSPLAASEQQQSSLTFTPPALGLRLLFKWVLGVSDDDTEELDLSSSYRGELRSLDKLMNNIPPEKRDAVREVIKCGRRLRRAFRKNPPNGKEIADIKREFYEIIRPGLKLPRHLVAEGLLQSVVNFLPEQMDSLPTILSDRARELHKLFFEESEEGVNDKSTLRPLIEGSLSGVVEYLFNFPQTLQRDDNLGWANHEEFLCRVAYFADAAALRLVLSWTRNILRGAPFDLNNPIFGLWCIESYLIFHAAESGDFEKVALLISEGTSLRAGSEQYARLLNIFFAHPKLVEHIDWLIEQFDFSQAELEGMSFSLLANAVMGNNLRGVQKWFDLGFRSLKSSDDRKPSILWFAASEGVSMAVFNWLCANEAIMATASHYGSLGEDEEPFDIVNHNATPVHYLLMSIVQLRYAITLTEEYPNRYLDERGRLDERERMESQLAMQMNKLRILLRSSHSDVKSYNADYNLPPLFALLGIELVLDSASRGERELRIKRRWVSSLTKSIASREGLGGGKPQAQGGWSPCDLLEQVVMVGGLPASLESPDYKAFIGGLPKLIHDFLKEAEKKHVIIENLKKLFEGIEAGTGQGIANCYREFPEFQKPLALLLQCQLAIEALFSQNDPRVPVLKAIFKELATLTADDLIPANAEQSGKFGRISEMITSISQQMENQPPQSKGLSGRFGSTVAGFSVDLSADFGGLIASLRQLKQSAEIIRAQILPAPTSEPAPPSGSPAGGS